MAIDEGVNGMFYLSLATLLCSSLTLLIRFCYKSKCSEFKCLCIKIKRDVNIEKKRRFKIRNRKNFN